MRKFYAHIFGKIVGPSSVDEIKNLEGFNRGTMVYPEELIDKGTSNDWKLAFQISEFGNIPFTAIKPPLMVPARQSKDQKSDPPNQAPDSTSEKTKLEGKIIYLEKELEKAKNSLLENENLKTQIREKDQKIYELLQENRSYRESSLPPKISVPLEVIPSKKTTEDYAQIDIPIKRMLDIAIAVLLIGAVSFALFFGFKPNGFIRRMFSKSQTAKSAEKSSELMVSTQTAIPSKQTNSNISKDKSPSLKKDPLKEKKLAEQKILETYKQKKAAQEKANSYLSQKISFNESDPNYQSFLDAKEKADLGEKEYKELINTYKNNYGEEAWNDFVERVKKSQSSLK